MPQVSPEPQHIDPAHGRKRRRSQLARRFNGRAVVDDEDVDREEMGSQYRIQLWQQQGQRVPIVEDRDQDDDPVRPSLPRRLVAVPGMSPAACRSLAHVLRRRALLSSSSRSESTRWRLCRRSMSDYLSHSCSDFSDVLSWPSRSVWHHRSSRWERATGNGHPVPSRSMSNTSMLLPMTSSGS